MHRRNPKSAGVPSLDDLRRIVALADSRPVFATLNAPSYPAGAVPRLVEFGRTLLDDVGVAALIVAEWELLLALCAEGLAPRLHVSSLASCRNPGAAAFYRDLGVARVILPRHMTLAEIEATAIPGLEWEVFVLNDGCIFEEGTCATTHALGTFCMSDRLGGKFGRLDERYEFWKWTQNNCGCQTSRGYTLGPCGLCALPRLARMGVASLKVVGREASLRAQGGVGAPRHRRARPGRERCAAGGHSRRRHCAARRPGALPERPPLLLPGRLVRRRTGGRAGPVTGMRNEDVLSLLRRYAHHLSGKRRALAVLFFLSLGGAAVSLSTPLLGKAFVDAVASRADFAAIPMIAAALLALAVLDLALATLSQRVHARLSADVLAELRAALFARCVDGPLEAVEPFRHGDLLTRFGTDVPRIQSLLVDGILGGIQNVLFLGVAAAITFSLSPVLALWSFLGLALALAVTTAFRRGVEHRTHRVREAMADLSHFLSERLSALRAIRIHRSQREEQARLADASARLNREVVGFQVFDAVATGTPGLLLTLALAWIYVVGGGLLEAGTISLGTFVAFVLYQGRLFGPAQGLLGLVRNLQAARVSLVRVAEVLGPDEPAPRRMVPASENASGDDAIVLADVAFAYAGKPPVFDNVDLRVRRGERVALFGASGAGKSTLVQLLFGLRQPSAGAVLIDGRPAHDGDLASRRDDLGYAGAEPFLLHATVEENLRYGNPDARRADVERAAALAEAHTFIAALPAGYATVIGGRGLALSDGQRQRLGLARLFLANPRVLVLDEAFSALDLDTEARVRESPVAGVHRSHRARHFASAGRARGVRSDTVPARRTIHHGRAAGPPGAARCRSGLGRAAIGEAGGDGDAAHRHRRHRPESVALARARRRRRLPHPSRSRRNGRGGRGFPGSGGPRDRRGRRHTRGVPRRRGSLRCACSMTLAT